jgi:hypothetical protein
MMKTAYWIGALVAGLMIGAAVGTAEAASKKRSPDKAETGLRAIQLQCMKDQGAWLDPATKRWTFMATERDIQFRVDAVHACVKQRSGKNAPFLTQRTIYH